VKSSDLIYTEADRLARYTGGAVFVRPGLKVKSAELRAYLTETKSAESKSAKPESKSEEKADSDSRIDKAFADGHVEIVQTAPDRTRTGIADHAEYYTSDERITLRGGQPQLVDTKRGNMRGTELTLLTMIGC
jgi:lipopolysaccharide export system protein LptA